MSKSPKNFYIIEKNIQNPKIKINCNYTKIKLPLNFDKIKRKEIIEICILIANGKTSTKDKSVFEIRLNTLNSFRFLKLKAGLL